MSKNKKNTQILKQGSDIVVHEFAEHIDGENVRLIYKQNDEVKEIRHYIIRARYEHEKNQLEQQIQTLLKQIHENSALRILLEDNIQKLIKDKEILESKIKLLEDDNCQLKCKNDDLTNRVLHLEKQNTNMVERLEKYDNEQHIRNLIVAIQDVNHIHTLEQIIDKSYAPCLVNLRNHRTSVSHYILSKQYNNPKSRDDPDHVKNYKKKLLLKMLNDENMKTHIETIEDEFGVGLIDEIKKHLINFIDDIKPEPTENEKQKILNYWK